MKIMRAFLWIVAFAFVLIGLTQGSIARESMDPNSRFVDGKGYIGSNVYLDERPRVSRSHARSKVHHRPAHKKRWHPPRKKVLVAVRQVIEAPVKAANEVIATVAKVIEHAIPHQPRWEEYRTSIASLWESMQLSPNKAETIRQTAQRMLSPDNVRQYKEVEEATGVPTLLIAALHYRESNGDFSKNLSNGEPWNRRTRMVPRGKGPYKSWKDSAIAALTDEGLTLYGRSNWTMEREIFAGEAFNGWGYRYRGIPSAYVWAGSTKYKGGKFVADGRFRRGAWDDQLGIAPLMAEMINLDPSLAPPLELSTMRADHPAARGYIVLSELTMTP